MAEVLREVSPGEAGQLPALLVWCPGMAHEQAPVHAQQGWRQGVERLRRLFDEGLPSQPLQAPFEGLRVARLDKLVDACHRYQLSTAAPGQTGFSVHLGVAAVGTAEGPAPVEVQRALCVARHAPIGTIGLQAEVVDAVERSWELPLVDLGEVQCPECGETGSPTRVLALTAGNGASAPDPLALRNVLAVLTPALSGDDRSTVQAVSELLVDTMIAALARSALVRVVARDSVRRLGVTGRSVKDAIHLLQASHVLHSRGHLNPNGKLLLHVELIGKEGGRPSWTHSLSLSVQQLLAGDVQALMQALGDLHASLVSESLREAQLPSWPSLEDHQLMMAASQLMHRLSPASLLRSRELLEALVNRRPEQALGHAWQAKWHVMAAVQGLQPRREAVMAAEAACQRALACDPHCALALALQGYALIMEGRPPAQAREALQRALDANPNEAFAWLFSALQCVFDDKLDDALHRIQIALALSPLDPWRYLFDAFAAHVHLARGDAATALVYAENSARLRARHAPTLFYLVIAHARLGNLHIAQDYLRLLNEIWPSYSLRMFWKTYAGRECAHAQDFAWALTAAGLKGA